MSKGRVLSGVQPTGRLHLGNYLGALKQWSAPAFTEGYESFFCVVDLHAITVPGNGPGLREASLTTAAAYIASGVDPKRSVIFRQSAVPAHTELQWILACSTPMGWLRRMTQFKEKSGSDKETSCLGLLAYPVLMAADILLYDATVVPVGEDQKQHIELARDIAQSFNVAAGSDVFVLPEPSILSEGARVMSLRDGTKKMSKSDTSDASRINLQDSDDEIRNKIKRAKTDSALGIFVDPARPEISNLLRVYAATNGEPLADVEARFRNEPASRFKDALADMLCEKIGPVRDTIARLLKDDAAYILSILNEGEAKAREISAEVLARAKEAVGLKL